MNNYQETYFRFAPCLVHVEVVDNNNGDMHAGSAFHVGNGVFITARHVLENMSLRKIERLTATSLPFVPKNPQEAAMAASYKNILGYDLQNPLPPESHEGPFMTFFHEDKKVDIGGFRLKKPNEAHHWPYVQLGQNLDGWFGADSYVLSRVVVFGHPPIPTTTTPYLISTLAEVNAVVKTRFNRFNHFILSSTARGGFSGGLVVGEYGETIGVVVQSLTMEPLPTEFGFLCAISVEPIYECLVYNCCFPEVQNWKWTDFWYSDIYNLVLRDENINEGDLQYFNDGIRAYIKVTSRRPKYLQEAESVFREQIGTFSIKVVKNENSITLSTDEQTADARIQIRSARDSLIQKADNCVHFKAVQVEARAKEADSGVMPQQ